MAHDDSSKLQPGAIYIGDNGRLMCANCAGATALYSGHDLSGQKVERLDISAVREFARLGCTVSCECRKVRLREIVDAAGWPIAEEV